MRPLYFNAMTALVISAMTAFTPHISQADTLQETQLIANCLVCHNDHVNDIPDPRGFSADTISKALLSFRDDSREATIMNRIAKGFDDAQIAILANAMSKM